MKILVVCGAGASSTFVAQRMRRAAQHRGLDLAVTAGAEPSLRDALGTTDVVLVGPHFASEFDRIQSEASNCGAVAALLPEDVFTADPDGDRSLDIALAALKHPDQSAVAVPPQQEGSEMTETTRTVRIASANGLHARPAKLFATAAKEAGIPVTIAKGAGKPVNATSILGVIALALEQGDYVTLSADGDGAEAVLDALTDLLTTDHDAEA